MEHSYKKAAAAVIALALIAAVILGIVLASPTSPTAIPSEEGNSSLSTVNAQIASDVNIGAVDQVLNPAGDPDAVRNKWNKPGATVTPIGDDAALKKFLGTGVSGGTAGSNAIGVLTKDITLTVDGNDDLGVSTFVGILDGNGHKITINATGHMVSNAMVLSSDKYGLRINLEGSYRGTGLNGMFVTGLLVGVNEGTIANLSIDYTSNMSMPSVNGDSVTGGDYSLYSVGNNPAYMSIYGIVTGVNAGTIDNVRVNVQDDFVGRQQASHANAESSAWPWADRNSRSWENTAIAGTLAGILATGSITNAHVDLGDGITVGAFADGWKNQGVRAWRNGVAISGGMVGFFVGNDGSLTNSYLSGTGRVAAVVGRGDTTGAGKGYNAFSGGITGGKFKYSDGQADEGDMIDSTSASVGDINAQIRGIVVSWTGFKYDNNVSSGSDDYNDNNQAVRNEPGTLIDTAKHESTLAVALTYDYDTLFDNLSGAYAETGISNTGSVKDWTEVYYTGGSADVTVEVKAVDGSFRIQATTEDFKATDAYQPLENVGNTATYQQLPSGYTGEFIWALERRQPIAGESSVQEMTLQDHTRRIGAMVYLVSFTGQQSAHEIVFGTMAEYGVTYQEGGRNFSAMMYDGAPVNEPTLSLTAAGEAVSVQPGTYSWLYQSGATEVTRDDTMFPGTYTFRPRQQVVDDEGKVTATYAYLDETNRVVVPEGQGAPLTFNVLQATFDVTSAASNGAWTKEAVFNGALNTSGYATYGQTAPSGNIFDAFTYQANNTQSAYQEMNGATAFQFSDTATTAAAGRVYNNFTVYKLNSAGEYVAVGSARASLTVRVDNAAPLLEGVRYYAYSGDGSAINVDNIAEHYFKIKDRDPAYTDVTAEIGDGGWTKYNLFVVVTATDERRSGVSETGGAGIQIELQTAEGASLSPLSPQAQINYGNGEGQDLDLGAGNAAAIGYISNSYTLKALLIDKLGNSNNSSDLLGTLNVDTTQLSLDEVDFTNYFWFDVPDTKALNFSVKATVGASGAEIEYLIVDKDEMESLGLTTSDEVPAGYDDEWVSLGAYSSGNTDYTVYESYADGAAVFVKLVSSQGLYDDRVVRLYPDSGPADEAIEENKKYPYLYVDLVTMTVYVTDEAITVDGTPLSEIVAGGRESEIFSKQYDGSATFDPVDSAAEANKMDIAIDWAKAYIDGSGMNAQEAQTAIIANGYAASGLYEQYENVGDTTLTWSFEVGNDIGTGYQFRIVFGTKDYYTDEKIVDTYIDYRDYDIGVEGIVKGDADFANYLDADANTVTTTYWGTNAMPFPVDFHVSTGFGDDLYFRYAYIGGENGVFNAGGNYKIAVDAVKIVPEGTETPEDAEWVEFELDENGSGDLPKYDNYNFHFTTDVRLVVEKIGVLTFTSLNRLVNDGEGGQVLAPEDMTTKISYDGFTHVVSATYSDVYKEAVNAVVKVYGDPEHLTEATINEVGKYYVVLKPVDEVNYYIAAGAEQVFEVVSTTIDLDTADQSYAYNNGSAVDFVVRDGDGTLISVEGTDDSYDVIYFDEKGIKLDKAPTEIGAYEVYVVYTAGAGSKYSTGRFAAMLTINKATPKILGVTENAITYDKGLHTYVVPDDPDNTEDGLKMVNDYLDGSSVYEFADAENVLVLQYLVEDGDPNNEDDWQNVDKVGQGDGWFKDAGAYTFRYRYGGDSHYNAVTSDPVTLTINKAVYGTQSTIPTDFLLFKDNTNTAIPTAGTSGSGDDGLPIYTVDYNAKSQYLTAKSETFFDYSGAEPVAIEPGAEITYYREGNLLDTTRPETLNMQLAQDYLVTVTITSNNYQDFVYQMHYVIATIDIPQGAITVTTEGGSNITTGTSAEDPQPLSVTYDGKEHGYLADNSGEIIINYDRTKLLEYDPENASSTPANASITYYPDGNQSNTLVDVGSYSGYYLISVGLTNYKPIRVYVTMTITPADAIATIEWDESITNVTSETNINNVMSGVFTDVNGNEQQGTLVFTDASGNTATPDDQGRLPAGTYTVTVVDSSGNYVLKGETASLTIAEPDASHVHTDVNGDNVCDSCGANVTGIHVHVDADGDGVCDNCGQQLGGDQPQPHDHVDANGDGKCDICGAAMDNQGGNDPVDDPDDGGNTATIVGGVLIGATALIVAGTVVGAILIVRKKRKNVI